MAFSGFVTSNKGPSMHGTIASIHWRQQRGSVRDEERRAHQFRREDMVLWLDFNELRIGSAVCFEVDDNVAAINIECPNSPK